MNENEFKILYYIYKNGKTSYRNISTSIPISIGTVSNIMKQFIQEGYINEIGITELGLSILQNYKVKNAIILAAGPSSRFVPLSIEQPKGLFKVKGEVLIERQIQQLKEAGIENIYIILGYKKETFFYLQDKYNVKFIINTEYNKKNNIESLYMAKDVLDSSYICSSDNYFTINPFQSYEYQTFYASVFTQKKTNEMYVDVNNKNVITNMQKGRTSGNILLGHSYWNKDFSSAMIKLMEKYHETGEYDNAFWEKLVADHLDILPKMGIKEYPADTIFEFDFVEELRAFDNKYVNHTESKIMANICLALKCNESDILNFKPMYEGLTNTSFIFSVKNKRYVYRQPGDGTSNIINRHHEKIVLEAAKLNQFDTTFLYMNEEEGWKISSFVEEFREPDYHNFEDSKIVINLLKKLHKTTIKEIDWDFYPVEEALRLEKMIKSKTCIQMQDYEELKQRILKLYDQTKGDGVERCLCHGDTYKHNWMITPSATLLIDWEYASISDPGIDVGYYIVDAMYSVEDASLFIKEYCGNTYTEELRFHYLAYAAIIAFYWFVWALYRESCGAIIGESLFNWYTMAKKYSTYLEKEYSLENAKLTRCEFEILKYVDSHNIKNDARYISNLLLFPWEEIKQTIATCLDKNLLEEKNAILYITNKGKEYLKPYRVERAVIMAAGFGSRMAPITLERPKPLVKVNGIRIIDTLIDALIKKDIKEIYIVIGYKKEMFQELLSKYPYLHFIENDLYNTTNNISSIIKALPQIDKCYICEADFIVSNPDVISKYHYCSNYLGAYVKETDDWCFKSLDGYAVDYKKEGSNCYQAFGISYWNSQDSKKLQNLLPSIYRTKKGKQEFWESCVFNYFKDDFKVEINPCTKFDIVEIDNFSELVDIDSSYKNYQN